MWTPQQQQEHGNIYGHARSNHGQDPDNNTSRFYSGWTENTDGYIISREMFVNHDNSYGAIYH